MGKLNGGVFLLDLSHITLEESDDSQDWSTISDEYTLAQLDKLKQYLVNPSAKKTIWCKLVDDNSDVVCQGALLQTNLSFLIDIHYYNYHLQIAITFDFDVETGEPFIDTATWNMLSLEQNVSEIIGSGIIDNAKPIYCHPISIDDNDSDSKVHIALLIFDNNNEEYNTLAKLKAKLLEIFAINPDAIFPITGALYYDGGSILQVAQKIGYDSVGEKIYLYAVRPDGTQGNFNFDNYLSSASFYDGVNKIN